MTALDKAAKKAFTRMYGSFPDDTEGAKNAMREFKAGARWPLSEMVKRRNARIMMEANKVGSNRDEFEAFAIVWVKEIMKGGGV